MKGSVRDLLRKRVAPLLLAGAVAVVAVQTCEEQSARVTVNIVLGAAAPEVEHVRVDYFRDGDPIDAYVERDLSVAKVREFEHAMSIPPGPYEARFRVRSQGETRRFSRSFQATPRGTVTLDIGAELR